MSQISKTGESIQTLALERGAQNRAGTFSQMLKGTESQPGLRNRQDARDIDREATASVQDSHETESSQDSQALSSASSQHADFITLAIGEEAQENRRNPTQDLWAGEEGLYDSVDSKMPTTLMIGEEDGGSRQGGGVMFGGENQLNPHAIGDDLARRNLNSGDLWAGDEGLTQDLDRSMSEDLFTSLAIGEEDGGSQQAPSLAEGLDLWGADGFAPPPNATIMVFGDKGGK